MLLKYFKPIIVFIELIPDGKKRRQRGDLAMEMGAVVDLRVTSCQRQKTGQENSSRVKLALEEFW